jgi:glucose-6-phosphate dehydrogenase assembly protein OpcA
LQENSAIVRELTREHACRAILVELDRSEQDASMRAWVTVHCHLSQGQKSVCCEQISFALKGVSRGRFRNTVFAHVSSDLPLVVWWRGELSPLFGEGLYSVVDRFVFDSAEWAEPADSFERIRLAVSGSTRGLVVQDLAWTRSYHFRLAVASLFDEPLAQLGLTQVNQLQLRYHPQHRTAALELLAWTLVQAGWEMEDLTRARQADGALIAMSLEADATGAPLAMLCLQGMDWCLRVQRDLGSPHLQLSFCAGEQCAELLAPADPDESKDLVGQQLARGGKNSLFLKILPMVQRLLAL